MSDVDKRNIAYWDELCGTNLAKAIGVIDNTAASLQRFDDWFFEFYPYLCEHVKLNELSGLEVLEVGLGYGSLAQKIAESGARYMGLDIAKGPVEIVRHRLRHAGLPGAAVQGSILAAPFPDRSFDRIITIGCLHHTGGMRKAVNECRRLLRVGGSLTVMVYYAYSYRRWTQARKQTLKYLGAELFGYRGTVIPLSDVETWSYDHDKNGRVAPHTDFISVKSLRDLCRPFASFEWKLRNIAQEAPFKSRTRDELLNTRWPDIFGLEIYATAKKLNSVGPSVFADVATRQMAGGMSSADQAAAPDLLAEQSSASPLTLNAEVYRICITDGGYPAEWPQHPHCPCCGVGQLEDLFTKHQFNHRQCTNCGFVCVDPYPPEDILKKLYAGSYYTNFREFYEARHLREVGGNSMTAAPLELLEQMIESATRGRSVGDWLDVGGGLGTVAHLVRQRRAAWTVTLNEFNPRSLELAQEIYGLDVVSNDADKLRQMGCRFDVISAVAVLEHITDPLSFLTSYAELLKHDGILVLIVPQFTRLNAAVSKAASPNAAPPFHVSLFNKLNLGTILDRLGRFGGVELSEFGAPAFSLLHHYDTSDYWDISIPSEREPVPKGFMIADYPPEIARGLNALGEAESAVADYFAETDGRLFLMAIAGRRP